MGEELPLSNGRILEDKKREDFIEKMVSFARNDMLCPDAQLGRFRVELRLALADLLD